MKRPAQKSIKLLFGLFGLVTIILIAIIIPSNPQLFQGQVQPDLLKDQRGDQNSCISLKIKTIPEILNANQSGTIIVETNPMKWPGPFTVSSSSGTLVDSSGNESSFIETTDKVINFSGGDARSTVTVQAKNSEICVDSTEVREHFTMPCESLTISTYPEPPVANESLEISFTPSPNDWQGSYLITADSGKLTLSNADPSSLGTNTNTLITTLRKVIYNGGKAGEKITVHALGEGNQRCNATLTIETE